MAAIAEQHSKFFLRRIDIGSWDSPVAKQYGIKRLPSIWLYEDGRLYSKDHKQVSERLQQRVTQAMGARAGR